MIADLLRNWGEVNLFTRPRRFGKSLNMNMLKSFFEIGCDKGLFQNLNISKEKELCEKYMGQFPVIFISLKGVEGLSFEAACKGLANVIGMEVMRFSFLKDSPRLTEDEKALAGNCRGRPVSTCNPELRNPEFIHSPDKKELALSLK